RGGVGRAVLELAARALSLGQPQANIDVSQLLSQARGSLQLAFLLGSMLSLELDREQALLESPSKLDALRLIHAHLSREVQVLELRQKIAEQAQTEMTKQQRDYMLCEQMKAIREELGEQSPEEAETAVLRRRLGEADLPDDVRKEVERELARLEKTPPAAPDYQLTRAYLELVLELPWRKHSDDMLDLARARQVLDEDHYDLSDIKGRILEQLAILKLNP